MNIKGNVSPLPIKNHRKVVFFIGSGKKYEVFRNPDFSFRKIFARQQFFCAQKSCERGGDNSSTSSSNRWAFYWQETSPMLRNPDFFIKKDRVLLKHNSQARYPTEIQACIT